MSAESQQSSGESATTRRRVLSTLAAVGIGSVAFQRGAAVQAETSSDATVESIKNAEWISGITLSDEQRETAVNAINGVFSKRDQMRAVKVRYDTLPAIRFDPEIGVPGIQQSSLDHPDYLSSAGAPAAIAENADDVSFLTIRQLGKLLRDGKLTAVELAKQTIDRLRVANESLNCVVNFTEELALKQAAVADRELSEGKDRGPLHGIPWGAKDLIAVKGYPTTWGAPQFQNQVLPRTATVAKKLEQAGTVLVAKMSLGALAMGDKWFGGQTRNPWNPQQGSSGSSAGSASAVAAGLLPFALGSETLGSIVSPCKRCGVTGLRPTFGRVSRKDCMALSWTMDKIGPIARSVDDCGIVFNAIHGADDGDPTSVSRWFNWPMKLDLSQVKIGRIEGRRTSTADEATLAFLEELGADIVPIALPSEFPEWAISIMLDVEAATVFHDITAANNTEGLNQWPDIFRKSHFLPAIDYLHASRLRTRLIEHMADVFQQVDLYVGGDDLGTCNLTGHPTIVLPTVMSDSKSHAQPICSTLTSQLYNEATLLAVANLLESRAGISEIRPSPE